MSNEERIAELEVENASLRRALRSISAAATAAVGCTCPAPCSSCPPLSDDDEAEVEYRSTRHNFDTKTTGRGLNPRPA